MIRHQTVPEDPKAGPSRVFQQQLEVNPTQWIGQEDVAPSVPALCDMMREAGRDGPRCSGHAEPVQFAEIFLKKTSRPSLVSPNFRNTRLVPASQAIKLKRAESGRTRSSLPSR